MVVFIGKLSIRDMSATTAISLMMWSCHKLLFLFLANYLDNWKCIAVLRGDGMPGLMNGSSMNGKDPKMALTPGFNTQRMWYS